MDYTEDDVLHNNTNVLEKMLLASFENTGSRRKLTENLSCIIGEVASFEKND